MDSLEKIFAMQAELAKLMPSAGDTCGARVANLCTALLHEVVELQRLTNWKWWRQPVNFDVMDARKELADVLHFTIQIALELGMTSDDMLREYASKNAFNHERQAAGYFNDWQKSSQSGLPASDDLHANP